MKIIRAVGALGISVMFMAGIGQVWAQPQYPTKPVRLIVPSAPGGTSDFIGRLVAGKLSENLGQQVVVENRPGAAEIIGADAVAKAAPDGYTILLSSPAFTVNPALQARLPYDSERDFLPVAQILTYPQVLVAAANLPANSVKELITLAKQKPGEITYGSGGNGAGNHLAAELFKSVAGIDLTHVPYKGNGPAITDMLGGRVQLLFTGMAPVEGHLKSGKLKALAVTGSKRLASAPEVPTMAEAGLPAYDLVIWYGVLAPAGTPKPIIDRLNGDLRKAMADPDVKARMEASLGADMTVSTPETFGATLRKEFGTWGKLVKDMNIKAD